jgi:hypothetical protein
VTESAWTAEELDRIGVAEELANAPRRADGTLLRARPIWVVRVGDQLYVRSWRGADGSWFQTGQRSGEGHISAGGVERDIAYVPAEDAVNDAVDAAYRDKYGRYPSYVEPMVAAAARATTLKLVPRDGEQRA